MARKRQAIRCNRHRGDGAPCTRFAMIGQLVCYSHGGQSPQAKAAAAVRLAERQAAAELALLGQVEPVRNAVGELAQLAGEALAMKRTANARSAAAGPGDAAAAAAAERAFDKAVGVVGLMARLRADERAVWIDGQAQAVLNRIVVGTIRKLLAAHGLPVISDALSLEVRDALLAEIAQPG
jgi:hypothetical protein